jgi:hypothetical protein
MFFINLITNTPFSIARLVALSLVVVLSACSSSSDNDVFVSSAPPTYLFFDFPAIAGISATDELLGMATTGDGSGFTTYGQAYWPAASGEVDSLDFAVNDNDPVIQFPAGDNPYVWQHILADELDIGPNIVSVIANIGEKQIADILGVTRGTSWMHEVAIQYDAVGTRWLLLDKARRALLSIDLADGKKTVLSAAGVGSGVEFSEPVDFVVDVANGRALVVDSKLAAVIAVDLVANIGDRSIFSNAAIPNAIVPFNEPVAIVLGNNDNAYIADRGHQDIIEMNLAATFDGERMFVPVASNVEPAQISIPVDIDYHASSNRLFVADSILQNIIAIDLDDDSRTIFEDTNPETENTLPLISVRHLLVSDDVLYVSDAVPGIAAIDLDQGDLIADKLDGERSVLSSNAKPNAFNYFVYPSALAIDNTGPGRLLVIDNLWGVLISVELTDIDNNGIGHRNYLAGGANQNTLVVDGEADGVQVGATSGRQAPALNAVLQDPRGIIFAGGALATLDRSANRIITIDPVSGMRGSLEQIEVDTEFVDPRTLAADDINLYVVDVATDQVTQVSNSSAARARLPVSAPAFVDPVDSTAAGDITQESFVFDTLYVLDKTLNDIVTVNLLDGDEDGVSDGERNALGLSCLVEPVAMIWHAYVAENVSELLIIDRSARRLLFVDLTSATPASTCTEIAAIPAAVIPVDLALDVRAPDSGSYDPGEFDAGDWSVLILDAANSELIPVGVGGDNRGVVGPAYTPQSNMNDPFVSPIGLVVNNFNQRAYVLDDAILSAYAVDLRWRDGLTHAPLQVEAVDANVNAIADAQRVIFSRGTSLNCDPDEAGELTACDFVPEE